MNWDELAEEAAQPFGDCRSHDMRFVHGARWQRERIRECFSNYPDPRCDEHPDGDPISCGWKNAYISIMKYLEETE